MRDILAWILAGGILAVLGGCNRPDDAPPRPAAGAVPVELRYRFAPGQIHGYDVTIKIDEPNYIETQQGWLLYRVMDVVADRVTFRHEGSFDRSAKPKNKGRIPVGFLDDLAAMPGALTIDNRGNYIGSEEETGLPHLLGTMQTMVFEHFSLSPQVQWHWEDTFQLGDGWSSRFRFFPSHSIGEGKEAIDYAFGERSGSLQTVHKTHRMTAITHGTDRRTEISGSGSFVIDTDRGLIASSSMDYHIQYHYPHPRKPYTKTCAATVECRLMSPSGVDLRLRELKEREDQQASLAPPPPPPAATASVAAAAAVMRTWSDTSGRFRVEASLVSASGGRVTLKKSDGSIVDVPLERLSPADQAYVGTNLNSTRASVGTSNTTAMVGGTGGWEFRYVQRQPLLGLRYTLGEWGGEQTVGPIEAIFAGGAGEPHTVVAKPGFAVGALNVQAGEYVNALQLVFMRLKTPTELDPTDSYSSDWIGYPGDKPVQTIGGSSAPAIGLSGRRGAILNAVGLVFTPDPDE